MSLQVRASSTGKSFDDLVDRETNQLELTPATVDRDSLPSISGQSIRTQQTSVSLSNIGQGQANRTFGKPKGAESKTIRGPTLTVSGAKADGGKKSPRERGIPSGKSPSVGGLTGVILMQQRKLRDARANAAIRAFGRGGKSFFKGQLKGIARSPFGKQKRAASLFRRIQTNPLPSDNFGDFIKTESEFLKRKQQVSKVRALEGLEDTEDVREKFGVTARLRGSGSVKKKGITLSFRGRGGVQRTVVRGPKRVGSFGGLSGQQLKTLQEFGSLQKFESAVGDVTENIAIPGKKLRKAPASEIKRLRKTSKDVSEFEEAFSPFIKDATLVPGEGLQVETRKGVKSVDPRTGEVQLEGGFVKKQAKEPDVPTFDISESGFQKAKQKVKKQRKQRQQEISEIEDPLKRGATQAAFESVEEPQFASILEDIEGKEKRFKKEKRQFEPDLPEIEASEISPEAFSEANVKAVTEFRKRKKSIEEEEDPIKRQVRIVEELQPLKETAQRFEGKIDKFQKTFQKRKPKGPTVSKKFPTLKSVKKEQRKVKQQKKKRKKVIEEIEDPITQAVAKRQDLPQFEATGKALEALEKQKKSGIRTRIEEQNIIGQASSAERTPLPFTPTPRGRAQRSRIKRKKGRSPGAGVPSSPEAAFSGAGADLESFASFEVSPPKKGKKIKQPQLPQQII